MFTAPRHPYTRVLIASLPSLEHKGGLQGIPGLAPLLRDLPPGCAFHPRCPLAVDRCRAGDPCAAIRSDAAKPSVVACHLAEAIGMTDAAAGRTRRQDLWVS